MRKLHFRDRSSHPLPLFRKSFHAASLHLASSFLKSDSFKHAATKGGEREVPIRSFLSENLPGMYKIVKGEVVDLYDNHSPQMDLMIFDGQRNFAFCGEESAILPAEAFLVGVEVKSLLTKSELETSLRSAEQLKKLKPFGKDLVRQRERGKPAGEKCRYFYCLFAYNTDIASTNWLSTEYTRLVNVSNSLKLPHSVLDRVYVANHGLIHPFEKRGITEQTNSGVALMSFYVHILNFLIRENRRRNPAPYIDYAGKLTEGWQRLR